MCVAKQWILFVKKSEWSCCGESKRSAEVQLYNVPHPRADLHLGYL